LPPFSSPILVDTLSGYEVPADFLYLIHALSRAILLP
jgi:hypothetical protein